MNLTNKDYQKIVKYYNIRKPANKTHKQVGEEILANKLCKCIKSVGITNNSESRAIAICRNSIFNNKNLGAQYLFLRLITFFCFITGCSTIDVDAKIAAHFTFIKIQHC